MYDYYVFPLWSSIKDRFSAFASMNRSIVSQVAMIKYEIMVFSPIGVTQELKNIHILHLTTNDILYIGVNNVSRWLLVSTYVVKKEQEKYL